ncbi:MAG: MBL fold metallo-hydrolase [Deltaproteobacteria bacterium]|nr:MBL fold metallo-hydrolase [Deltaproteobacteria bacterium]
MKLSFLGGAGTVTGSKYLVETQGAKVLVDCGLYQGVKQLRLRNWKRPPTNLEDLDAVILTHAHIDHAGYLPALVRDGFTGPVYCTPPTKSLCQVLLPDSGHIHEEDAAYANRKGFSRHHPAVPLYTESNALRALEYLSPLEFGERADVGGLGLSIQPAGHILGAGSVEVRGPEGALLFSGDLGRDDDLLMRPPVRPEAPDWVVMESTYGDRIHPEADPIAEIGQILARTLERGGTLLIPAFAVARAQCILFCLHEVFRRGLAPEVPVYMNSPMATSVTELYQRFSEYHRLSDDRCAAVCGLAHFVRSVEESRELTRRGRIPAVIISASGMATGGRVLHHLKGLAPDPRNAILLPGFQAPGTRGHAIVSGAEVVKIHGDYVPIRAEVIQQDILSAHADQPGLLGWVGACERPPKHVFVTHGEAVPADVLRRKIQEKHHYPATVPEYREEVELA